MKPRTITLDSIALASVLATALLTWALSAWAGPPMATGSSARVAYVADYYLYSNR